MRKRRHDKGFTLVEILVATALTVFIFAGVYLWWATLAKTWMAERVK